MIKVRDIGDTNAVYINFCLAVVAKNVGHVVTTLALRSYFKNFSSLGLENHLFGYNHIDRIGRYG